MKDGTGAGEPVEVSRQDLYDAYVNSYRQLFPEVGPCRDSRLLEQAAQYLLREPEPRGKFTVFPFYQAVSEGSDSLGTDCRKHLSAFAKATELLETLCVNLFLQPWKKEIRTLKTFTGPFVYCLLPVLSSSTIKSVMASIGYLPNTDPPSEFRLSEDANPDRAMQVGFELLLARVECYNILQLLDKDQLGPQEWLEVLQRRVGPRKPEKPTEKRTTAELKEEADRKEPPLYSDTRLAGQPQPKPRRCHQVSVDQSIMEMQRTYPDLAFRGRPLVADKPHKANSHRSSIRPADDDSKGAELPNRDGVKGSRAAASTAFSKNTGAKADEAFADNSRSSNDRNSGGATITENTICSSTDEAEVDDGLSGPQAISLHITLRSKAEKSLKPGPRQPTAEPAEAAADAQYKSLVEPEPGSLSSVDEQQELRELAQRMGQLHMHDTKEEVKRKEEPKKGGENTNKERRRKSRKAIAEGDQEEQNLRKPVMETGPALNRDSRRTRSTQPGPTVMKEQNQPNLCQPSPMAITTAECESWKGGGGTGQQEEHPEDDEVYI